MTELDQAPATAAAETADQSATGDQRPGGHDSQARYPSAVSTADTNPGYYDGDIQAALAADTTPTRQQASRDASAQDHAAQVGDTVDAPRDPPANGRDPDIEAILHENDGLPDPRTRQQAARDAAAETNAANWNGAPTAIADQRPFSGPDPLAASGSNDTPEEASPVADHAAVGNATSDRGHPDHADRDQHVNVVHAGPEDRTLGDTTPTGIGLKPTGDQLLDMETDDPAESRLDRFLRKATEEADDLHDGVGSAAEAIHDFRLSPGGAAQAYEGHGGHDHPAPLDSQGVNDMVGGAALTAVVMVTAARRWIWNRRKEADR
jgi:hypothetical protein